MSLSRNRASGRSFFVLALCSVVPLLPACSKKETPVFDAGPPPPPTEEAPTVLLPMEEEDAGDEDAGAEVKQAAPGKAVNPNVTRLKQCCNALAAEAKRLGASPEAGVLTTAAAQCTAAANQAGATGNAPELGALRGLLAGRNIPALCSNL